MDVGKFLRLQGAIQAAIESVGDGQAAVAGPAMAERYETLVVEARLTIPETEFEEFDRLFPKRIEGPRPTSGRDMFGSAKIFNEAKALLGTLAGYLGGYVNAAKIELEAEAYAKERVRQERGVGFKPPSTPAAP